MKVVEMYNQYGWRVSLRLFKSFSRRLGILTESFYLLEYTIKNEEVINIIGKYNYEDVIELQINDFEKSQQFTNEKLNLYQKRFDSKDYSCYGIKCGNELIYSTWISWKKLSYPTFFNQTQILQTSEALLEDSYCNPNYRGKGYHSKMNLYRINQIMKSGKSKVLALVLKENTPALKVQVKSGFKIYKEINLLRIGRKVRIKEKIFNERDKRTRSFFSVTS